MKRLITYMAVRSGENPLYAHEVTSKTPVEWLEESQAIDSEERCLILNVLRITDAEAKRIDGNLDGM
ncbi:hypothetical protein LCGC14_0777470 [marine sediment metagenome]|uniref:Uncharacterized protein n=1 Tax=marine sediment metagenome TaxID=412755 RepID=A0A0F9QGC9_9ZZZZ